MMAALAQAFMQNPVAKMATTWFGDKEVISCTLIRLIFREVKPLLSEAWQCPLDV
jgi:hypothetical protein